MELLRPIDVKPIYPKNGDKWRGPDKIIREFRYGRWVILTPKDDILGLEKKQLS